MKIKDIKVGMKVVPIKKSFPGWGNNLMKSACWERASNKKQPFLYVKEIELRTVHRINTQGKKVYENLTCIVLTDNLYHYGGDFFHPSDFSPYKPKKDKR